MEQNKYQWQGEPVKVEFGYCRVTENQEKPLYWYNYECNWDDYSEIERRSTGDKHTHVPAIKVIYRDQIFCIANHYGIGVHKLINGGWPSHRHFSLPVEGFNSNLFREEREIYVILKFDLEGYQTHESNRIKWQMKNYPKECEDRQKLIDQFKK